MDWCKNHSVGLRVVEAGLLCANDFRLELRWKWPLRRNFQPQQIYPINKLGLYIYIGSQNRYTDKRLLAYWCMGMRSMRVGWCIGTIVHWRINTTHVHVCWTTAAQVCAPSIGRHLLKKTVIYGADLHLDRLVAICHCVQSQLHRHSSP